MSKVKFFILFLFAFFAATYFAAARDYAPETWFHIIGGNASKEGIAEDIKAIAEAGISGIQFFHGGWENDQPWPGVKEMIAPLSEKWEDLVLFASRECAKRGLKFKMQNCPGWSMSGGPWITLDTAMRKLVAFEKGKMPEFDQDDDYRKIGEVTFPWGGSAKDFYTTVTFPNPQVINHNWAYEMDADLVVLKDGKEVFRRECPKGAWQDSIGMTFRFDRPVSICKEGEKLIGEVRSKNFGTKSVRITMGREEGILDNWEAKAGWGLRSFSMSTNNATVNFAQTKTLVFGHVNAKRKNHPAPKEGTGWECDKMSSKGFEANWAGYIGRLLKNGIKVDGTLVDSWECGVQSWTWEMESEFKKRAGYDLRPWMPALFGYILGSEAATEKFLLDWRRVCSLLIEENYYGTIARLARENGMSVQYETAFGDVISGDILRYWKYADEPMCEFWHPHENKGFVGSHNFKPVLPCVSAAHIYGKRRVSAEALTSFNLTFDESFDEWKKNIDRHFGRGVTHIVFHTYTHNPVVGGKAPSTSFGGGIGSPFLRLQTWWPFMKDFTAYLEFCGRELERGLPVVDILMYLGDDLNHKTDERTLLFDNKYKYDYINHDALMTRVAVKDGRIVFPDGFSARVLWIPANTYLTEKTSKRIQELVRKGARVVRGNFKPDWPSPLETIGRDGKNLHWYQRRDGIVDIFFVAEKNGASTFLYVNNRSGKILKAINPVTRKIVIGSLLDSICKSERINVKFSARKNYPVESTQRVYTLEPINYNGSARAVLNLGKVRSWARVTVNGKDVAQLWCEPYECDITPFLEKGENKVEITVVSSLYNQLVSDAKKPESDRMTWTKNGPSLTAPYREAGLYGPVTLTQHRSCLCVE